MSDFALVVRKEWLESLNATRKERMRIALAGISFLAITAFLPFQIRVYEFSQIMVFGMAGFYVMLTALFGAGVAYAGERERHTLETLLATRLSDRSIFLGKLAAMLLSGLAVGFLYLVLGLLIVTIIFGRWESLPLAFVFGLVALLGSLVPASMLAAAGLHVSARSSSIKQAMQTTSIFMMVFFLLPLFGTRLLGDAVERLVERPALLALILFGVAAGLVLVDIALILWGAFGLKRERLMLV